MNEAGVVLYTVNNTPGLAKAVQRFANGMNVPITFNFTGLAAYPNLKFVDITIVDAAGNSDTIRGEVIYETAKAGHGGTLVLRSARFSASDAFTAPLFSDPGEELPPIELAPRRN
jgi:hypothetical protein